jgi:hypothetical protein
VAAGERVRSRKGVREANPNDFKEETVRASLETPLVKRPESVGYVTLVGMTVVSARTLSSFTR